MMRKRWWGWKHICIVGTYSGDIARVTSQAYGLAFFKRCFGNWEMDIFNELQKSKLSRNLDYFSNSNSEHKCLKEPRLWEAGSEGPGQVWLVSN